MQPKHLIVLLLVIPAIFISGCVAANPEAFVNAMPLVQEFLAKHPNADIRIVHYSANESASIIDQIRADCGKLSVEPKEYYFVNISDPSEGMHVRAWIDWKNQVIECAYKEGDPTKPVTDCEPRYRAECFGDHVYWFDSCGNREAKKEFCPLGCDESGCIKGAESCDVERTYYEKPSCTCPEGYEMIEIFPRCEGNDCMARCEERCRQGVIEPCIEKCVAEYACQDDDCRVEVKEKCSSICQEKAETGDCVSECSRECLRADGVTGAMITGMPYANAEPVVVESETAEVAVQIASTYTAVYEERCVGSQPLYRCVKIEQCRSHAQARCYGGHVYWFDSCGRVEEKKEYCENGCENGLCSQGESCGEINGYCIHPVEKVGKCTEYPDGTVKCEKTVIGGEYPECEAGYILDNTFRCEGDGLCCVPESYVKKCEDMGGVCVYVQEDMHTVSLPLGAGEFQKASTTGSVTGMPTAAAPDFGFAGFWTDKTLYYTGDKVSFYASLTDSSGNPATPEEGNSVYIGVQSSPTGATSGLQEISYNYDSGYYEFTTTPAPASAIGEWTFYAVARNSGYSAESEKASITIKQGATDTQAGGTLIPPTTITLCGYGYYPAEYWCPDGGLCCMPERPEKERECYDSDGGPSFYKAGYVKLSDGSVYEDYCRESQVVEFYCNDDGTKAVEDYWCPNGCSSGACLEAEKDCWDSDSGRDYGNKGVVETADQRLEDYCNDDGTLTERYCENGAAMAETYTCPSGTTCFDGACVKTGCEPHSYSGCFEGDLYWYDSCNNKEEMKEDCTAGCENGTCLQAPEKVFAITSASCENSTILVRVKNTGEASLKSEDFTASVDQQAVALLPVSIEPGEESTILSHPCEQGCPAGNYSILISTADAVHDGLVVCG